MKKIIIIIISLTFFSCATNQNKTITEQEALQIAEKKAIEVYSKDKIEKEKPLKAELKNDNWIISGTLNCPNEAFCVGGVVEVIVSQKTGEIISITHGK